MLTPITADTITATTAQEIWDQGIEMPPIKLLSSQSDQYSDAYRAAVKIQRQATDAALASAITGVVDRLMTECGAVAMSGYMGSLTSQVAFLHVRTRRGEVSAARQLLTMLVQMMDLSAEATADHGSEAVIRVATAQADAVRHQMVMAGLVTGDQESSYAALREIYDQDAGIGTIGRQEMYDIWCTAEAQAEADYITSRSVTDNEDDDGQAGPSATERALYARCQQAALQHGVASGEIDGDA